MTSRVLLWFAVRYLVISQCMGRCKGRGCERFELRPQKRKCDVMMIIATIALGVGCILLTILG